jgi:glycosyltransferase involved in cell wall biosynthesis
VKVLVFPHHLELGGSQVNAIELAAAGRDLHGHEVVLFATPGPALELVRKRGLRYVEAPAPRAHPSPSVMRALLRAVRDERPDLVHAWDWPQCLDAFYGVHLARRMPLLASNMSMGVTRFLPRSIPITYGTPELVETARRIRGGPVYLLEPPVDTQLNAPDACDARPFLDALGVAAGELVVVIVSRLVAWLKLDGVERAMHAAAELSADFPLRLVVVGGGPAAPRLEAVASSVNARAGRTVVTLTGPMADPRPAYAAADVALGMGGSALRAMAFGKPCIVLGEDGFSLPFTPETSSRFLWSGFYGAGQPDSGGLAAQLRTLVADPARRSQLGEYSRGLVEKRFSLTAGATTLNAAYQDTVAHDAARAELIVDAARTALQRLGGPLVPTALKRQLLSNR